MIKKFTTFLHKALEGNPAIGPALTITEALYCACRELPTAEKLYLATPVDPRMALYFAPTRREYSDITNAFDQSQRVETHIQPRTSCHVNPEYTREVHIRFYRAGEKTPIYRLSAALADGKIIFQSSEVGRDFIRRKKKIVGIERLTQPQQVCMSVDDPLDIRLLHDEVLRVRYGGTLNYWPPHGGDYFHIQHFKKQRKISEVDIKASPCYQYLVDIGHGLVLYPHGDSVVKEMPFQPAMRRCTEWAVRKFNPVDWKDMPIKSVEELTVAEKAA